MDATNDIGSPPEGAEVPPSLPGTGGPAAGRSPADLGGFTPPPRVSTGIPGLDEVLSGGLLGERIYVLHGAPGTGKTTLAMQFLLAGSRAGETGLYVTFSESREEIHTAAGTHGWAIGEGSNIHLFENLEGEDRLRGEDQYTVFDPADVELNEMLGAIIREVDRLRPRRVVVDSVAPVRLLARDPLRYRRQVLALKAFFQKRGCTVLLIDDATSSDPQRMSPQTVASGVIELQRNPPEYGPERRRIRVEKLRCVPFHGGWHDVAIRTGGMDVFPRLSSADAEGRDDRTDRFGSRSDVGPLSPAKRTTIASGVRGLDEMLGGGLGYGTSVVIAGAAGAGKSTLVSRYASAVAAGGEKRAAMFLFEESLATLTHRSHALGDPLDNHVRSGRLILHSVNPAELSAGEFSHRVRSLVEEQDVGAVIIDSLNGYMAAVPGEQYLHLHLRELYMFLRHRDVLTLTTVAQTGLPGDATSVPAELSYLADGEILLRFFEHQGEIRQAISVVKMRDRSHERTLREFAIDAGGIRVGAPLRQFQGVFSGIPSFVGDANTLLSTRGSDVQAVSGV